MLKFAYEMIIVNIIFQEVESETAEKANRAKTMLLKKKLEEKDRIIVEKEEILKSNAKILEDKNKIIKERENTLQTLATQLAENNKLIEDLQSGKDVQSEVIITSLFDWGFTLLQEYFS